MEFTSRKAEAASDQAVPERLAILAEDADVAVQRIAAKNLRTPQVALERLSHSPDRAVRRSVALNSNPPRSVWSGIRVQFAVDRASSALEICAAVTLWRNQRSR